LQPITDGPPHLGECRDIMTVSFDAFGKCACRLGTTKTRS
jgi:hypothetical protein